MESKKTGLFTDQPSIAAGWESYRRLVVPSTVSQVQVDECKLAFYAGATVLFYSILKSLDEGDEPTEGDLQKMDDIHEEIERFTTTFDQQVIKRRGNPHLKENRGDGKKTSPS